MTDVVIRVVAQDDGSIRVYQQHGDQLKKLGRQTDDNRKKTQGWGDDLRKLKSAFVALGIGVVVRDIARAGVEIDRASNAIRAAVGDQAQAAREMEFVRREANRLGVEFVSLAREHAKLTSATRGTNLAGAETRKLLTAAAQATRVFGGSADDTAGVLRALTQVMSKGTLQAEEIRGQIGERIPGAFRLAAQAMNVTQEELSKMLETGQVTADEFLPKFADELLKASEAGREFIENSPETEFARFHNTLTEVKNEIAQGGLMDVLVEGAKLLKPAIEVAGDVVRGLGDEVIKLAAGMDRGAARIKAIWESLNAFLERSWDVVWTGIQNIAIDQINAVIQSINVFRVGLAGVGLASFDIIAPLERVNQTTKDLGESINEINARRDAEIERINQVEAGLLAEREAGRKLKPVIEDVADAHDEAAGATKDHVTASNEWADQAQETIDQMREQIIQLATTEEAYIRLEAARALAAETDEQQRERIIALRDELLQMTGALRELEGRTEDVTDASDEFGESINQLMDELFPMERQLDTLREYQLLLNIAFDEGVISAQRYEEAMARVEQQMAGVRNQQSGLSSGGGFDFMGLFGSLAGGFSGGNSGIGDLFGAFQQFAGASQAAQNGGSFNGISTGSFAAGGFASAFSAIGGLFGQEAGPRTGTQEGIRQGLSIVSQTGGWWGAVAAALLAIDDISGGSLIGTAFQTVSAGQQIDFGPGGASGFNFQDQERRRSLFRGTARQRLTTDLDDSTQELIDSIFQMITQTIEQAANALGTEVTDFVSGYWRTVTDAEGNTSTVSFFNRPFGDNAAPRGFQEDFDQFQIRLLAENLIAQVAQTVGDVAYTRTLTNLEVFGNEGAGATNPQGIFGTITDYANEAQVIAERWRDDAELLLDGAQLMVQAMTDINDGQSLINGTLTETVDIVEEYQQQGEGLLETYERMVLSTAIFTDALDLIGITIDGTREELVRFATEAAEAAGGTERMRELWGAYFSEFFSATELAEFALNRANERRASELGDIGVDANISNEAFRALFEQMLPTLTPEQLIEWLEAAEAIAAANAAQQQYNDTLNSAVDAVESILERAREAGASALAALENRSPLELAIQEINDFFDGLIDEATASGATLAQLAEINRNRQDAIAAQNALAARELEQFLMGLEEGMANLTRTPLEQALAGIQAQMEANIAYALELGATEEQLAEIRAMANAATQATLAQAQQQIDAIMQAAQLSVQQMSPLEQQLLAIQSQTAAWVQQLEELGASAVQIAEVLEAGQAAQQNAINAAQQQIDDIIAARQAEIDGLSGLDATLAQINASTQAAIQQATLLGATEEQLAIIRAQGVTLTQAAINAEEERLALLAQQAEAQRVADLANLMRDIDDAIAELTLSDFAFEWRQISIDMAAARAEAIRLGASVEELARIEELAALRTAAAIDALKAETMDLISQLFGTPLEQIDAQIAALSQSGVDGFGQIGTTLNNVIDSVKANVEGLQDFLDSLMLSDISPLTPAERLAEAQSQFDAALAAAIGGDQQAIDNLPGIAQALLDEAFSFHATGSDFNAIFDSVTAAIQGIIDNPPSITVDNAPTGSASRPYSITPSAEMLALQEQRDALLAEQAANERIALATQIAQNLNELASALGQPLWSIAEELGVNIEDLIGAFGLNLEELTVETTQSLANISNLLGVELVELSNQLGLELGELADAQSLLNDALEAQIGLLPPDIQAQLGPLLQAIEQATNETDANAAIAALEAATSGLPQEYRDLLAPFFDNIDPVDPLLEANNLAQQTNTELEAILQSNIRGEGIMEAIRQNVSAFNASLDIPSYDVGTGYVPRTGPAMVHEGEMILTRQDSDVLRRYGVPSGNSADVVAELRRLRNDVQRLRTQQARNDMQAQRDRKQSAELIGQTNQQLQNNARDERITQQRRRVRDKPTCGA